MRLPIISASHAPRDALGDLASVEGCLAALGQRPERSGEVVIGHDLTRRGRPPVGAQHVLPVGVGGVLQGGNSIVISPYGFRINFWVF